MLKRPYYTIAMKVVLVLGVKSWTEATAFVQTYRPLLLGCDFSNYLLFGFGFS